MKWLTVLALSFVFTLPPSGLTVDSRLQDRMAFAEQLLSECSPSTYSTLRNDVAYVEYQDSIGKTPAGITSSIQPSVIRIVPESSDSNFVGVLAHEIRHVQQFRSPVTRILILIPAYHADLERDANDYSFQVQHDCRVGNFALR